MGLGNGSNRHRIPVKLEVMMLLLYIVTPLHGFQGKRYAFTISFSPYVCNTLIDWNLHVATASQGQRKPTDCKFQNC